MAERVSRSLVGKRLAYPKALQTVADTGPGQVERLWLAAARLLEPAAHPLVEGGDEVLVPYLGRLMSGCVVNGEDIDSGSGATNGGSKCKIHVGKKKQDSAITSNAKNPEGESEEKIKDPEGESVVKTENPEGESEENSKDPERESVVKTKNPEGESEEKSKDPEAESAAKTKNPEGESEEKSKDPEDESMIKTEKPEVESEEKSEDPEGESAKKEVRVSLANFLHRAEQLAGEEEPEASVTNVRGFAPDRVIATPHGLRQTVRLCTLLS